MFQTNAYSPCFVTSGSENCRKTNAGKTKGDTLPLSYIMLNELI